MGNQGIFESGEAVREGWARDQEDEIGIDGYNAYIKITTNDGTTGLQVVNSSGGVAFLAKSDGDGYVARNLGIGTESPTEKLDVRGVAKVYELQVTTGAISGYVLTSDGEGVATWQPPAAATELILDGYVRETTFQDNKTFWNESVYHLNTAADGYVLNTTFEENKGAQEEINDNVLVALDGYAIRAIEDQRWIDSSQQLQDLRDSLDGYLVNQTFEENKGAQEEINDSILFSLDGYETKISAQENYDAIGSAIITIRKDLDGYAQTEQEHHEQHSEALLIILKDLDGYETKISAQDNYDAIGAAINTIRKDLEDAYADISGPAADGYIVFFTGPTSIAGDNDLYFDRVSNQLQVSSLKLTTEPNDGYVLTSDTIGNATWQKNNALDDSEHRQLDQLVHIIAEDSFEEYIYSSSFVTNIIIWTNNSKIKKIREEQFTYSGAFVSQIVTIQYNTDSVEVERITETYTYSGAFVTNIERVLT